MKPVRRARRASWAERSGRKPYEHGRNSVSYIGSNSMQNRPLRHLVFQRRDAQWPFRAVRLRDVVPSHRRRDISAGLDARQQVREIGLQVRFVVRPPSRRRCRARHPCASDETPRTSIRGRSGDAARSAPARGSSSPDRLSIVVSWTGSRDSEFPPVFPAMVLCARRLPSLRRVPASPVPRFHRYYEAATTSRHACPVSLCLRLRVPSGLGCFVFAGALPTTAEPIVGPGALFTRRSTVPGHFANGRDRDLSGSLATPPVPLPCSETPAEPVNPGHCGLPDAAPGPNTAKASALS